MKVWMILGIVAIIFLVIFIICMEKAKDYWKDFRYTIMSYISGCIFAILIVNMIFFGVLEEEYNEIVYDNIYSVRGVNNEVNATFFLGTGVSSDNTYYVVFVEDDKGLRMEKFDTRNTYIVEIEDNNYCVKKVKEKWKFMEYNYIYVPKGTVIVEFKI